MSTTTARAGSGRSVAAGAGARAVAAALLAIAVTFWIDHGDPAGFGLLVLGGYLVLQAVVLAVGIPVLARTRSGRVLVAARAAVSAAGGVLALATTGGGVETLRPLEAVVFLVVGALEIIGGLRGAERSELAGDAVVVGGLQVLVGAMLVILNPDPLLAVGVLGAWGAVVAVYLGISAVNLRRRSARA